MSVPTSESPSSVPLPTSVSSRRHRRRNRTIAAVALIATVAAGIAVAVRAGDTDDTAGTMVSGVTFTRVAAGKNHVLALDSTGKIWSWGSNSNGQLGNTELGRSLWLPTQVDTGTTRFTAVLANGDRSGAIDVDGTVWFWGAGRASVPSELAFSGIETTDIAEIEFSDSVMGLLDSRGRVHEAGYPGNPGDLRTVASSCTSLDDLDPCPPGVEFKSIAVGSSSGEQSPIKIGLGTEDRLHIWGERPPVLVEPLPTDNWKRAAVGASHIVALRRDGTLWIWGYNTYGELCNGGDDSWFSPMKVTDKVAPAGALNGIVEVYAGEYTTAVLNKYGKAYMCGDNSSGQLGIGNTTDQSTFQRVGETSFSQIEMGRTFTVAIDTDGHLWSWGYGYGLGLGAGRYGPFKQEQQMTD